MTQDMAIDETLPEMVRNFLASGGTLESIRLDAESNWWHKGGLFEHKKVMRLFSRSVDRTEGGTWVLNIGRFTYPIEVDDTGFFVERVTFEDNNTVRLFLSDESTETLKPDTLRYQDGRGLYCTIKEGRFEAHFKRPAYYAFQELFEEQNDAYILRLGDKTIPLLSKD